MPTTTFIRGKDLLRSGHHRSIQPEASSDGPFHLCAAQRLDIQQ
jgi:hypothetical protein